MAITVRMPSITASGIWVMAKMPRKVPIEVALPPDWDLGDGKDAEEGADRGGTAAGLGRVVETELDAGDDIGEQIAQKGRQKDSYLAVDLTL